MSHQGTEDKFLQTLFPSNLQNLKIIEIGHGLGMTGLYIKANLMERGTPNLLGVDIFKPYHILQQGFKIYDELYLGDAAQPLPYQPKTFNLGIAQQTIEHFEKLDGYKMLENLETVVKDRVIITTPLGYHISEEGRHGNPASKHRSAWYPKDFTKLGYKTKTVSKNVNSRAVQLFAKTYFTLQGKTWENQIIVAWKDLQ